MTVHDDIHQRFRFSPKHEHLGSITDSGPQQSDERHALEKAFADRSNEQSEMIGSSGQAFRQEMTAWWSLSALLVLALLAIPTPDTPRPGAVSTITASTPHPTDTVPTRAIDPDDPVPCSDLDYAYLRC